MQIKTMEEMLLAFDQQADVVKKRLKDILGTVADRRIPKENEISELEKGINELSDKYNLAYSFAKDSVVDEELPAEGSSLTEIADVVKTSKEKAVKKQLEAAENILKRFSQVTSNIKVYADLLTPFQDKAIHLLKQLDGVELSTISSEVETPSVFLQALDCENITGAEGIQLLENVNKYFPQQVSWGLAGKQYYYADNTKDVSKSSDIYDKYDTEEEIVKKVTETKITEENIHSATGTIIDNQQVMKEENQEEAIVEKGISVSKLVTVDSINTSSQQEGQDNSTELETVLLKSLNKVKTSSPKASSFKNEIGRLVKLHSEIPMILAILTNMGIMTKQHIHDCLEYIEEEEVNGLELSLSVDALVSKGLLGEFEVEQGNKPTKIYCLSQYSLLSMFKDSLSKNKKLWGVSFGKVKVSTKGDLKQEIAKRFLNNNDALMSYLGSAHKMFSTKQFELIMNSIKWEGDHYSVATIFNDQIITCYLYTSGIDVNCITENDILVNTNFEESTFENTDPSKKIYICKDGYITLSCKQSRTKEADEVSTGRCVSSDEVTPIVTFNEESSAKETELNNQEDKINFSGNLVSDVDKSVETKSSSKEEIEQETLSSDKSASHSSKHINEDVSYNKKRNDVSGSNINKSFDETCEKSEIKENTTSDNIDVDCFGKSTLEESLGGDSNNSDNRINVNNGNIIGEAINIDKLIGSSSVPMVEEGYRVIDQLANIKAESEEEVKAAITNAVLLARCLGIEKSRPQYKVLSDKLCIATRIFNVEGGYTSETLSAVFPDPMNDDSVLLLCAYLMTLLSPGTPFDYGLRNQANVFLSDYESYFPSLPAFKSLFNIFIQLAKEVPTGFMPAAISLLGSDEESEGYLDEIRSIAHDYLKVVKPNTKMKDLPKLYGLCFGQGSNFYECMSIIANNKSRDDLIIIETVLEDFCDFKEGIYYLNEKKIEDYITDSWSKTPKQEDFELKYGARISVSRQIRNRLEVMISWRDHINESSDTIQTVEKLKKYKNRILKAINTILTEPSWKDIHNANVLHWMLIYMDKYLKNKVSSIGIWSELLFTGVYPIYENGIPIIDENMSKVRFYEPWRNALKHCFSQKRTVEEIKAEILGDVILETEGLKDNFCQLRLLGKHIGAMDESFIVDENQIEEAEEAANERTNRFEEVLELAYTYNQVNETEKETILGLMRAYKSEFYERLNFACWRDFLGALESQIREYASYRKETLRNRLDLKIKDGTANSEILKEIDRLLKEDMNFAVAEEYLNRIDLGEAGIEEDIEQIIHDTDYFKEFLSEDIYEPLLALCQRNTGQTFKSFAWRYIENHLPKDWTNRLREDSRAMVDSWPLRKDTARPDQIKKLFECIGLNVIEAKKVSGKKVEQFQLYVEPTAKSMADYRHPIAAFGTQIKSPVNVVILYGNYTPKQLVDTISSLDFGGMSIVLIDRAYDIATRRMIGEIFHTQTSGQNSFLLIDYILFIYLAMHQVTERLPAMLSCTLPFSTYQPFVRDGGSTADEMFCGRAQELATIIDPNGACVVYGGRQLGKTALLERAESRRNKPKNKVFAIYVSIVKKNNEKEVVEEIVTTINRKSEGRIILKSCSTLKQVCSQINDQFRKGQISTLLLLIDEVDDFLAAIASNSYKEIQPLVDLKRETKNNFKFVIAGLHNVFRAQNATRNNGVFGQLGTPLCIKPLTPTNALQLLSRPLRYLGFRIERYPHLETILTNTNYYPGILQFFGYMLVETLSGQYAKYYHAADGNPPFTLQDEQLGAVMNSADLNKSIKEKFRWSLELDPRYFMIARCITMLYHFYSTDMYSGGWLGFSVDSIMEMSREYNIHCLEKENKDSYTALLDEMCEMGILSMPEENIYRLRRSSFVDIIGENIDKLEEEIINSNVEEIDEK